MALRKKPELNESLSKQLKELDLDGQRVVIGTFLQTSCGGALWDLMCGLRGPDTPCERGDLSSAINAKLYAGRRERKYKTAEIVRQAAFFGVGGGGARRHADTKIILPPQIKQDHFDKHQARAASVIGLDVEIESEPAKEDGVNQRLKVGEPVLKKKVNNKNFSLDFTGKKKVIWDKISPSVKSFIISQAKAEGFEDFLEVSVKSYTNNCGCCHCTAVQLFSLSEEDL